VLDDVERRRLAVKPSGEHSPPLLVAPLDVELDKGSGELLALPRRRRFAGEKANDRVPRPDRLSRPHLQVSDDPVALVEQADDRDPLGHRSHARLGSCQHPLGRLLRLLFRLLLRRLVASATRQDEPERNHRRHRSHHCYSGIQGW
jgi:hypothetical protein